MDTKSRITTDMLVKLGVLIAMEVVLSRFLSIQAWNLKIGFAFIPVVIAAMWYGPLAAGVVGAMADFLGAIMFPIGAYFPGFTATAFLIGIIFGIFLKGELSLRKVIYAVIINQLICSMVINSFWIHVLYGSTYTAVMYSRILQCAVLTVVEVVVTYEIGRYVIPALAKAFPRGNFAKA